jgi:Na+-translocating ferredoxin:NAD+ oxidoreductase RnfD subunit
MTAIVRPSTAASPFQSLSRFFRTPKGLLLIILALLTVVAMPVEGMHRVLPGIVAAVLGATLLDVGLVRSMRGVWFFPSGALLSGLIVGLIISPTEPRYVPLIAAALAVNSKYLFRVRGRHIFNPAALALVAAYFLFASAQDWWGALSNLPVPFVAVLLATGIFIADRVNKLPMILPFLGLYFALFTGAAFLGDPGRVAEIFRAPDVNAALFFALFMLTDPPTSPARYRDQVWFGLIVAAACFAIFLTLGGLYYLPAGLLIGNAWEAWRRVTARSRSGRPARASATATSG